MLSITTAGVVFSVGLTLALGGPTTPRHDPAPPTFAAAYEATGYIILPEAKLKEPFNAKFDANQKKSRIDYYNGTMRTFQLATKYTDTPEAGASFKIVWSPSRTTHTPELVCYQANATKDAKVEVQSVLPDLKDFEYYGSVDCFNDTDALKDIKDEILSGQCDVWTRNETHFNRTNVYTFFAQMDKNSSDYVPVRYVMDGKNTLFGSHYDKYELVYTTFVPGAQDDLVFDVIKIAPQNKCVPYPAGSGLPTRHLFNPMAEFVHHDESHLDEHFEHFKATHGKTYSNDMEESARKNNFRHNQRFINSHNRKNTGYALGINHLADMHRDDLRHLRGGKYKPLPKEAKRFEKAKFAGQTVPTEFDWRVKYPPSVSKVKDQAICGSCWSFGTTGHLEAMYALKYKKSVIFSEQQLIDCSWNYGNGGCDGGQDYQAYRYIMDHGLSTAQDYNKFNPYLGIDGKCNDSSTKMTLPSLVGYVDVNGVDNLKTAVTFVGPISVGIDAAHDSFLFYSHGIFSDKECKNTVKDLDHSVLVVGYGSEDGVDYWIIKNSWSEKWGDHGYVRMASADNLCGVATAPTYAILP